WPRRPPVPCPWRPDPPTRSRSAPSSRAGCSTSNTPPPTSTASTVSGGCWGGSIAIPSCWTGSRRPSPSARSPSKRPRTSSRRRASEPSIRGRERRSSALSPLPDGHLAGEGHRAPGDAPAIRTLGNDQLLEGLAIAPGERVRPGRALDDGVAGVGEDDVEVHDEGAVHVLDRADVLEAPRILEPVDLVADRRVPRRTGLEISRNRAAQQVHRALVVTAERHVGIAQRAVEGLQTCGP